MIKLIDTIEQLYISNAKAAMTLQFMSQSDPMFWEMLCSVICNDDSERDIPQKIRMAGITTFNTLARRKIVNIEIKSLGTLDEIYRHCKRLLFCETLRYQIKKQLSVCLRYLLQRFTYQIEKQIGELRQQMNKHIAHLPQMSMILLQSLLMSQVQKQVKLSIISQLIYTINESLQYNIIYMLQAKTKANVSVYEFKESYIKVKNWLSLLMQICKLLKEPTEQYEYEVMQPLYSNNKLSQLLLSIVYWQDENKEIIVPWIMDLQSDQQLLLENYAINKLKTQTIEVINNILTHIQQQFNLVHTQWHIMQNIPKLCQITLRDIVKIGPSYKHYNEQYSIGNVVSSMIRLLSVCYRFSDLQGMFMLRVEDVTSMIFPYLSLQQYEQSMLTTQPQYFVNYIEQLSDHHNEQVSKYAITELIHQLCSKTDQFYTLYCQICYNNYAHTHNLNHNNRYINQNVDPFSALLGILIISNKNKKHLLTQIIKLIMKNIEMKDTPIKEQLIMFKILCNCQELFINQQLSNKHILYYALQVDEQEQALSIAALDFIKQYLIYAQTHTNSMYLQIWNSAKQCCKYSKSYHYYQTIQEVLQTNNNTDKKELLHIMVICTERILPQYNKPNYDQLLTHKVFNLLRKCLERAIEDWVNEGVEYRDQLLQIVLVFADKVMKENNNASVQSKQDIVVLLGTLIQGKIFIGVQSIQMLFPLLLERPFIDKWLICMCYMITQSRLQYSMKDVEALLHVVELGLQKHSHYYINQMTIFALHLLNYNLPEDWIQLHQRIRVQISSGTNKKYNNNKALHHHHKNEYRLQPIIIIRLFHVYLLGFRLGPQNHKLQSLIEDIKCIKQAYTLFDALYLIKGINSSLQVLSADNLYQLFDVLVLVLNKLHISPFFFGQMESKEEQRLREHGQKVQSITRQDPYVQFRLLYQQLSNKGYNLLTNSNEQNVKILLDVRYVQGQVRRMFHIKKKQL